MRLDALLDRVSDEAPMLVPEGAGEVEVNTVVHDTRAVRPGALFCCVPGSHVDGHDLAADAVAAGATALLVERAVGAGVPELRVPSVRAALGPVAAAFWDHPSTAMRVVGVTGTSGQDHHHPPPGRRDRGRRMAHRGHRNADRTSHHA